MADHEGVDNFLLEEVFAGDVVAVDDRDLASLAADEGLVHGPFGGHRADSLGLIVDSEQLLVPFADGGLAGLVDEKPDLARLEAVVLHFDHASLVVGHEDGVLLVVAELAAQQVAPHQASYYEVRVAERPLTRALRDVEVALADLGHRVPGGPVVAEGLAVGGVHLVGAGEALVLLLAGSVVVGAEEVGVGVGGEVVVLALCWPAPWAPVQVTPPQWRQCHHRPDHPADWPGPGSYPRYDDRTDVS